jgi:23S rRNA (guanosine2251-2'-O)-methyltransferase
MAVELGKQREKMAAVTGRNAVLAALVAGRDIGEVLLDRGAEQTGKVAAIVAAAKEHGVPVRVVDRRELDRQAGAHHQGVIALTSVAHEVRLKDVLDHCAAAGKPACIVLLRELLHEHNLGAILRTMDAAGADAVVLPSHGAAALGAEAMRVSTGAGETVPVIRQSLTQALAMLRREGVKIIGAEPEGQTDYWEEDATGTVAFVLGGENRALSPPLRDACDALVRIPMVGAVTSLNVSVACALLLYERLRQMRPAG